MRIGIIGIGGVGGYFGGLLANKYITPSMLKIYLLRNIRLKLF